MDEPRFARLITMKVKRGRGSKFRDVFEEGVAAPSTKLKGLRRLYLLQPVKRSSEFVAISLWDDEKSAEEYAKSGSNEAFASKLADFTSGEERVKKFHVLSHIVGKNTRTTN